jgi:hypothetical protein
MQLGPDQVLVNVDIRFRRGLDVQELELAIRPYREEESVRKNRRRTDFCRSGLAEKRIRIASGGKTMTAKKRQRLNRFSIIH